MKGGRKIAIQDKVGRGQMHGAPKANKKKKGGMARLKRILRGSSGRALALGFGGPAGVAAHHVLKNRKKRLK